MNYCPLCGAKKIGRKCQNEGTVKHQKVYTDGQALLPGKGEWAPR